MRHYAIYNLKWPERVGGSFNPTPLDFEHNPTREWARKTNSALWNLPPCKAPAAPNQAPAKKPAKRRRDAEEETEASPPVKKPKVGTGRPRGRPPKNKVGMSKEARELLASAPASNGRRSGRARVPSLKMRENEQPKRRISTRSDQHWNRQDGRSMSAPARSATAGAPARSSPHPIRAATRSRSWRGPTTPVRGTFPDARWASPISATSPCSAPTRGATPSSGRG